MSPTLADQVAHALGRKHVTLEELPAGTSRGAMRVLSEAGEPIAFLRIDLGVDTEVTVGKALAGEVDLLRRAHSLGFTVPRVHALLESPVAAVMDLAAGTSRPDPADAERVGPAYMAEIARLHLVPPADFGLSAPPTVTEAISVDLETYMADAVAKGIARRPIVRFAAHVLRHSLPRSEAPAAMLHGDVGAGNFMAEGGRLTAILDWELAHAGDIHEDLAWLWTRGAHTPFGDPRQRIAEYEAAAGHRIDPQRLAWHVAFVTFKSVLGLQRRMHAQGDDPGLFVILIAIIAYEALLCAALARILGISIDLLGEEAVEREDEAVRLIDLAGRLATPTGRQGELLFAYLRAEAAQRQWNAERLREDMASLVAARSDELDRLVDEAGPERFPDLLRILAGVAGRRCKASPNAERRVQRALAIGLGGGEAKT